MFCLFPGFHWKQRSEYTSLQLFQVRLSSSLYQDISKNQSGRQLYSFCYTWMQTSIVELCHAKFDKQINTNTVTNTHIVSTSFSYFKVSVCNIQCDRTNVRLPQALCRTPRTMLLVETKIYINKPIQWEVIKKFIILNCHLFIILSVLKCSLVIFKRIIVYGAKCIRCQVLDITLIYGYLNSHETQSR